MLVTASAFDIRQDNTLTPGATPGFNAQQGQIGSRGLEFETRGDVTPNLELIASATRLDTEVRRSNTAGVAGKRPQAAPKQFSSIWASYRFASGALDDLNLGGGVRYVGASFGDDLNTVRSPSYTVTDLAIRYELGRVIPALAGAQLTFNVSDLFDRAYYTSCSYGIYRQFGNRRQVLGGLRYAWWRHDPRDGQGPSMSQGAIRLWSLVHKWTSLVCTPFLLMLCVTGLPSQPRPGQRPYRDSSRRGHDPPGLLCRLAQRHVGPAGRQGGVRQARRGQGLTPRLQYAGRLDGRPNKRDRYRWTASS